MAGIFAVWGDSDFAVRLAQIIFDAFSALMVFLIAAEWFNSALAIIAAVLAALSPHFGHYTLWTSPDTLCVLPILVAVYLTIKTIERPRLLTIAGAGAMVGLSRWLRANALLLAPFLVVVVARYSRGLEVIRSNPGWFLGVMCQRAFFMLTYNDSQRADWPFSTSRVPIVSSAPPPLHLPASIGEKEPVWSSSAPWLLADGSLLSQQAQASLDSDGRLRITGDELEFGDQFASGRIAVEPNNDYVLSVCDRSSDALLRGPASNTASALSLHLCAE